MYVREAVRVEVLIVGVRDYFVHDLTSEPPWCENRRIGVHVETDEKVGDQAELHDGSNFSGEVQGMHGRLLVEFQY